MLLRAVRGVGIWLWRWWCVWRDTDSSACRVHVWAQKKGCQPILGFNRPIHGVYMELQGFAWIIFRFKKEAVESEAGMLLPRQHDSMSLSHATVACSDLGARSATSQNSFFYTGSVVLCGIVYTYTHTHIYILCFHKLLITSTSSWPVSS